MNMQRQLDVLMGEIKGATTTTSSSARPDRPRKAKDKQGPGKEGAKEEPIVLKEIRGLLHQADRTERVPSAQEVVRKLKELASKHQHEPIPSQDGSANREAVQWPSPKPTPAPQPRPHLKLWGLDWGGATVLQAQAIRDKVLEGPAVIACQSESDYDKATERCRATGNKHGVTFVVFYPNEQADPEVMMVGPQGPRLCKAKVEHRGDTAPKRASLPTTLTDDTAALEKVATFTGRLTISGKFAANELFGRARQEPLALAALVFDSATCKRIL